MLLIVGTFRLAPAKLADAIPLMALMIEASRADAHDAAVSAGS